MLCILFVLGVAGSGAEPVTVVAGYGAAAVVASGSTYTAGATASFATMKYSDKNTVLIGPDDRPIEVNETVMQALQGAVYEFTHKAIWACWLTLPPGMHTARNVLNSRGLAELPPTEHWAFVARAEIHMADQPMVAYFIAQFGRGEFIPPPEEADEHPFRALLQENNKKAHAALSIVQGITNTDVWVNEPQSNPKRYVYRDGRLVSPAFSADEWVEMKRPMKLRELNEYIYTTHCTNREYNPFKNNCQDFSTALFNAL